jgi:hypothetical protein
MIGDLPVMRHGALSRSNTPKHFGSAPIRSAGEFQRKPVTNFFRPVTDRAGKLGFFQLALTKVGLLGDPDSGPVQVTDSGLFWRL